MKSSRYFLPAMAALTILLASCEEEVSPIGGSITQTELTIVVDSIYADLKAASVFMDSVDTRTSTKLLGKFYSPDYGRLECSFTSQLMCSAALSIPDSITADQVDSLKFIFQTTRGGFTGDSVAPQQLKLYNLERQLPTTLNSSFSPEGYYNPNRPVATSSYTLSAIAEGDTILRKGTTIDIKVNLPKENARSLFEQYKTNPDIFKWPQTFAKYYPGIYVEPSFGNGCVAQIDSYKGYLYYHYKVVKKTYVDGEYVTKDTISTDSTAVLSSAPEVLSATTIRYTPSEYLKTKVAEGESVLTTPGGYVVNIKFPAREIMDAYTNHSHTLGMISGLSFSIPASTVRNSYGLQPAPYLLMVKKAEMEDFFKNNRVPDSSSSFWAEYSTSTGNYFFSSMRQYLLDLLNRQGEISEEDLDFVLIPVDITTETYTDPDTYEKVTVVTRCAQYMKKPTMTLLHTDKALICFTYTLQQLK